MTTFDRPLPYTVSILAFDPEGDRIRVTRKAIGGWPEYSAVVPVAQARGIADQADADMDEMYAAGDTAGVGWTDGGFDVPYDGE